MEGWRGSVAEQTEGALLHPPPVPAGVISSKMLGISGFLHQGALEASAQARAPGQGKGQGMRVGKEVSLPAALESLLVPGGLASAAPLQNKVTYLAQLRVHLPGARRASVAP